MHLLLGLDGCHVTLCGDLRLLDARLSRDLSRLNARIGLLLLLLHVLLVLRAGRIGEEPLGRLDA